MTVPVHNYENNVKVNGFHQAAFRDPLWETCTPEEVINSPVGQYVTGHIISALPGGVSKKDYIDQMRKKSIESINFYRNAKAVFGKPKILQNTLGVVIPSDNSEGFSLNPGITITDGVHDFPYFGQRGLFRIRYGSVDYVCGLKISLADVGLPKSYIDFPHHSLMLITAAAKTNIDRIHAQVDPICEKIRLESPALLEKFIEKHRGNSKVAEQLSRLIFDNGWHDKDPEALFSILDFCRNNTDGIRDFSTWVRTHKSQIKLLDLDTIKQAVVLANVQTVNKA